MKNLLWICVLLLRAPWIGPKAYSSDEAVSIREPKDWPKLEDRAFPFHAVWKEIKNRRLVVAFYNYSSDTVDWFTIEFCIYDKDGKLLEKDVYNQTSSPYFMKPFATRTVTLPFRVHEKGATATVRLTEVEVK